MINNSAPQAHGTLRPFFSPPFSVFFGLIEPIAAHDGVTGAYETVRRTVLPSVPHAAFFPFFFFFFFAIFKIWSPRAGGPKAYAETLLFGWVLFRSSQCFVLKIHSVSPSLFDKVPKHVGLRFSIQTLDIYIGWGGGGRCKRHLSFTPLCVFEKSRSGMSLCLCVAFF